MKVSIFTRLSPLVHGISFNDMDELKRYLDEKVEEFNQPIFIEKDPISVPHHFSKKQDIEIAGFFAALLAWGNRTSILNSCGKLMEMMDEAPYDFIVNFEEQDLKVTKGFVHRTFNSTDLIYLFHFLQQHYKENESLESAFAQFMNKESTDIEPALKGFHDYCFSMEYVSERTRKHIATPSKNSACKRLNMYLRWMVREDNKGVDFGLWKAIRANQLICPLDVHSSRFARKFHLLNRKQNDWKAALELTENLRQLDAEDPVRYDFALFGLGVMKETF